MRLGPSGFSAYFSNEQATFNSWCGCHAIVPWNLEDPEQVIWRTAESSESVGLDEGKLKLKQSFQVSEVLFCERAWRFTGYNARQWNSDQWLGVYRRAVLAKYKKELWTHWSYPTFKQSSLCCGPSDLGMESNHIPLFITHYHHQTIQDSCFISFFFPSSLIPISMEPALYYLIHALGMYAPL